MIRHDSRLILRKVRLHSPKTPFDGKIGVLLGFRGADCCRVRVAGGVYSMARKNLTLEKKA